MELFTLGIGPYSERDVQEAAPGSHWPVRRRRPRSSNLPRTMTLGEKTILGQSGKWAGSDLIRLLLEHPATARRLAGRLCDTFMGEGSVRSQDLDELADGLRAHHLDIGWGVATILRSRAFFAAANLGTRVPGPVEFIVGALRALGLQLTRARTPWYWPAGRPRMEPRTCSTPRTSAAGPEVAPGSARAG